MMWRAWAIACGALLGACGSEPPSVPESGPLRASGNCAIEVGESLPTEEDGYTTPAEEDSFRYEWFVEGGKLVRIDVYGLRLVPPGWDRCSLAHCNPEPGWEAAEPETKDHEIAVSELQLHTGSWQRVELQLGFDRYLLEGEHLEVEFDEFGRVAGECTWEH
jgi:hypothetical protein